MRGRDSGIIIIEMFKSGLGLVSGIGLCCLAGSMYDHYDRGEKKQMKERSLYVH